MEVGAFDHQLFLATLALAYSPALWRKWLLLATLFAIGHSAAILAMTLDWLPNGMGWVEPAILLSIIAMALLEFVALRQNPLNLPGTIWPALTLAAALAFGVVHGLGYGSVFVTMMIPDASISTLLTSLLAFTLGIEVAQFILLAGMWLVAWVVFDLWQWYPLVLRRTLLIAIAAIGLCMLFVR